MAISLELKPEWTNAKGFQKGDFEIWLKQVCLWDSALSLVWWLHIKMHKSIWAQATQMSKLLTCNVEYEGSTSSSTLFPLRWRRKIRQSFGRSSWLTMEGPSRPRLKADWWQTEAEVGRWSSNDKAWNLKNSNYNQFQKLEKDVYWPIMTRNKGSLTVNGVQVVQIMFFNF